MSTSFGRGRAGAVLPGAVLVGALLALGACRTGDDLVPDTVDLSVPDRQVTLDVDGCGRDGDVIVVGASSASVLVQVLLRVDDDRVLLHASGVTVTLDRHGTLGAGDAELIDAPPGTPGPIRSASVRGDRIEIVADAEPLGPDDTVTAGRLELTARCTAEEGTA